MKNVIKIFKTDIHKLRTNLVALVIVGGLVILPSLYAWFNIFASWNPYENTKGITVVICNEDLGGKIEDKEIHIGDEVVEKLKENDSLGWKFVDTRDEAVQLAEDGKVYASIIIPKDFSEKMSTIVNDNPIKPSLEYYVNEKVNAISPKITDKGVSTIQSNISNSFVETVSSEILTLAEDLGYKTDDYRSVYDIYKDGVDQLITKIPTIQDRLLLNANVIDEGSTLANSSIDDLNNLQVVLNDTISFSKDFTNDLGKFNTEFDDVSMDFTETLSFMKISLKDFDSNLMKLKDHIVDEKPELISGLRSASVDLHTIRRDLKIMTLIIEQYDEAVSPEIKKLVRIINRQFDELDKSLEKLETKNLSESTVLKEMTKLRNTTDQLFDLLDELDKHMTDMAPIYSSQHDSLDIIDKELSKYITALNGKTKIPESLKPVHNNIINMIDAYENEYDKDSTGSNVLVDTNLSMIKNDMKSLSSSLTFSKGYSDLQRDEKVLKNTVAVYKQLSFVSSNWHDATVLGNNAITSMNKILDASIVLYINFIREAQHKATLLRDDLYSLNKIMNTIYSETESLKNLLKPYIEEVNETTFNRLDVITNQLNEIADDLQDTDNVIHSIDLIHALNIKMISNFDQIITKCYTDLTPSIKRYIMHSTNFFSDTTDLLIGVEAKCNTLSAFINDASYSGHVGASDMRKIHDDLFDIEDDLKIIQSKFNQLHTEANLDEMLDKTRRDKNIISNFLAQPVNIDNHALYSSENYGSSMTPFYTTLALWVGALVLGSLLTTEVKNVSFKPTALEAYYGKYLLFAILSMLQGLVVSVGDILILGVTAAEPYLLIKLSVLLSLIFCTIVFTLISLFGNVGKALGVILLVLQVAGSGGTFPIQMTPQFFQNLYNFLPFTYGIGAMREAIFGVAYGPLKHDLHILLAYMFSSLVVGSLFVSKASKVIEFFSHKLHHSGLTE